LCLSPLINTATPIPTFPRGKEFSSSSSSSSSLAYPKSFPKERTAIFFLMAFENTLEFKFDLVLILILILVLFLFLFTASFPNPKGWKLVLFSALEAESVYTFSI
jgi:hypothetical protein